MSGRDEMRAVRDNVCNYIRDNLTQICVENLEWENTSILCDGAMRKAAHMFKQVENNHALALSIIKGFLITILMQERLKAEGLQIPKSSL